MTEASRTMQSAPGENSNVFGQKCGCGLALTRLALGEVRERWTTVVCNLKLVKQSKELDRLVSGL